MDMNLPYQRKWVLVTGAGNSKRIGASIARHFAERGANILLHYRSNPEEAARVQKLIQTESQVQVELVNGDLSKPEEVAALFAQVVPDIVINNAAVFKPSDHASSDVLAAELAAFEANVDANMKATFLVTTEAVRRMRESKKRGVVVLIGDAFLEESRGAYPAELAAYTMSKAYVPYLVRQLAAAYGKEGLRFLGILNGPIEPPSSAPETTIEAMRREINLAEERLDPWIGGKEVAKAIDAMIQADAVNGASLAVDGGRVFKAQSEHSS